ncbi:HepT-like ribonuclease domain-containing protein [Corynebacterium sp. AOP40-9SA-29]|uniref:HepT-like ribonuclease domain-containing protein n=1 Tax=Corynebacterium sp. AOP40-9SA-29 TaxID=3457677 RepID=UPI0040346353
MNDSHMTGRAPRRDMAALQEIVRLCDLCAEIVSRGRDWYEADPGNIPGLAAESVIIKIGENVARLSARTIDARPSVPWSQIKRMRDRLAHHYEGTDYTAVWNTLAHDAPVIRDYITGVLEDW